ncbi:hypothetical protein ACPPVO_20460 [Dactylosporangium sp. McL0621]|uniref:hypothetical protein n=1 Tax=Dactylosporangium sp. McL0621 TaxID=3415678 RepID=UPI003CF8D3F6
MNCKTQVVLAAGTGYLLGRQRKLRWALLLAAAAASGRFTRPGSVLDHGLRALKSTPELGKIGELGAPLVAATKDAARNAVSGRIGSLTDKLRGVTETAPTAEEPPAEDEPDEEREPRRPRRPRAANRRQRSAVEEPEEPDDEADEDEDEEDDEGLVTASTGRSRGRPPVRRRRED